MLKEKETRNRVLREAVLKYMKDHQITTILAVAEFLGMPRRTLSSWIGGLDGTCETPHVSENKFDNALAKLQDTNKDQIINSLAVDIQKMLFRVQSVLSDEFTPEDRQKIRKRAGGDGVFLLSNAIDKLCSERARNTKS